MATTDVAVSAYIEPHPRKRDPAEARLVRTGTPVWSLIGYLIGVDWDRQKAATDYDIPLEAVDAAVAYFHAHEAELAPRIRRTLAKHQI